MNHKAAVFTIKGDIVETTLRVFTTEPPMGAARGNYKFDSAVLNHKLDFQRVVLPTEEHVAVRS